MFWNSAWISNSYAIYAFGIQTMNLSQLEIDILSLLKHYEENGVVHTDRKFIELIKACYDLGGFEKDFDSAIESLIAKKKLMVDEND